MFFFLLLLLLSISLLAATMLSPENMQPLNHRIYALTKMNPLSLYGGLTAVGLLGIVGLVAGMSFPGALLFGLLSGAAALWFVSWLLQHSDPHLATLTTRGGLVGTEAQVTSLEENHALIAVSTARGSQEYQAWSKAELAPGMRVKILQVLSERAVTVEPLN